VCARKGAQKSTFCLLEQYIQFRKYFMIAYRKRYYYITLYSLANLNFYILIMVDTKLSTNIKYQKQSQNKFRPLVHWHKIRLKMKTNIYHKLPRTASTQQNMLTGNNTTAMKPHWINWKYFKMENYIYSQNLKQGCIFLTQNEPSY